MKKNEREGIMTTYRQFCGARFQHIVEIKAVSELADELRAQVHNYLKSTGYRLGLLVDFGAQGELRPVRIVQ